MAPRYNKKNLSASGPLGQAALAKLHAADDCVIGHTDTGYTWHPVFGDWSRAGPANLLRDVGYDFVLDQPGSIDPLPPKSLVDWPGHGTRTLSLMVGAVPGKLIGVAPGAKVMPFRVTDSPVFDLSPDSTRNLGRAIDFILDYSNLADRVKVISISLGIPGWPLGPIRALGEAIDRAYEAGVIVVAAAGQQFDRVTYPGRYFRTIGVGAVYEDGTVWDKHAVGEESLYVDCYALGADVQRANSYREADDQPAGDPNGPPPHICYSDDDPDGGDEHRPHSGTSYATEQVAAIAALWRVHRDGDIRAKYGTRSPLVTEAFRRLVKTTSSVIEGTSRFADVARVVDVEALLNAPLPDAGNGPDEVAASPYLAANQEG